MKQRQSRRDVRTARHRRHIELAPAKGLIVAAPVWIVHTADDATHAAYRAGALRTLGFDSVADVRVGRFVTVDVNADSAASATAAVRGMCEKLLANPVIEDFALEEPTLQPDGRP